MGMQHDVVISLGQVAQQLQSASDLDDVLHQICDAALLEIPAAVAAGVTMVESDRFVTAAATTEVVEDLDQVQYRTGDGPCVTATRDDSVVRSDDLSHETRWPQFTRAAMDRGFRALLSFQLFDQDDNNSALNVYSDVPRAWASDVEDVGTILAAHAALAIRAQRKEANLKIALSSRDVIGQAKGILMERFRLDADHAFQLLVAISQRSHRKLREIAEELCLTGDVAGVRGIGDELTR
jgi:GAF domain-containing protein